MSTNLQLLLTTLVASLGFGGNTAAAEIIQARYHTIPDHGMTRVEYPFDRAGFYRPDWVDPRGKSPVSSSTTVREPFPPAPAERPIPVTFRINSDADAQALGYIGPYSKMNPPANALIDAYYQVKRGDTLTAIGRKFGFTVEELKKSNGLTKDLILVGQSLRLVLARHALGISPD